MTTYLIVRKRPRHRFKGDTEPKRATYVRELVAVVVSERSTRELQEQADAQYGSRRYPVELRAVEPETMATIWRGSIHAWDLPTGALRRFEAPGG